MGGKHHPLAAALGRVPPEHGGADPLDQHRELTDDRALPDGYGRHDHDAHPARGLAQVQSTGPQRRRG